ncbi:MAG TPA: ABC transporter permease [Solirubrobacterales bacterium]|nr:ABC transporter permease [Solirubrobacterales bacterium]
MTAAAAAVGRLPLESRRVKAIAASLAAVLLALIVGGLLMMIAGGEPISAYGALIDGAIGSPAALGQTLKLVVPFTIIGLGLALAFRGRVYNIGAEGQMFMGALAGGALAILLPVGFGPLLIALAIAAGVLGGAAWGSIVGVLRARWGVNEVITSLLLNFVAILGFTYVVRRPLREPGAPDLQGRAIQESAALPTIPDLYIHIGIFAAIALVPIAAWVIGRTSFGFRVSMLGYNAEAAQTAGVRSRRMIIQLMLISGGLAGLAGAFQILGVAGRLDPGISQGYGFTAIVVALLGRLSAIGVLLAAVFVAILQSGGQAMSVIEGLPYAIVLAIPGVFVVFLLIADRLARG